MLFHNVRYSLRLLRRSPGFSTVAVLTLALGIGANTAVFSVVDAVMLKRLGYADPDRLIAIWEGRTSRPVSIDITHGSGTAVAPANLADYARENRSFESLAGYDSRSMSLTQAGRPEQLQGESVTWNYLRTLGVRPALGRDFLPEDDRPGAPHVAIVAGAFWRDRFDADPSLVGRTIRLDGEPYTVVGVLDTSFVPLSQFESTRPKVFLVPAAYPDDLLANHGDHEIKVVGRLKTGITLAQARSDFDVIVAGLAARYPDAAASLRTLMGPLSADIARNVRASLLVLLAAVGLVLLVACVNVANLLIVRAVGQRREVAIRLAIGAARRQIVAEMLTRGLVLGAFGGAAGLLVGVWTRDALVALAPASIPRLNEIALDRDVLLLTLALSLATGAITGLLPAWQAARTDPAPALKASDGSAAGGRAVMRWRGALMAGEMAAALVLAVGAGLLVRSFLAVRGVDLGFETERVLAASIPLPETRYDTARKRYDFFAAVAGRVRALPGVQHVAFANRFPLRGGWGGSANFEGTAPRDYFIADFQAVNPGYFPTLGIPLVRGRLIAESDAMDAPRVAVVSDAFARILSPNRDPIGRRFRRNAQAPLVTIVGVVGQIRRDGKTSNIQPEVYLPAAQVDLYPVRLADFAVRAAMDPRLLGRAIQDAVLAVDPEQPITNVKTLDEVVASSLEERRFELILLASFAVLAVALALVGVYGVVAYAAGERTREIGIRVALGATRQNVVALVVRGALGWTVAGVAGGVAGSMAVTRLMKSLLFGVEPTDTATFATIVVAMVAVSLAASYLPARRAATIDPMRALRAE